MSFVSSIPLVQSINAQFLHSQLHLRCFNSHKHQYMSDSNERTYIHHIKLLNLVCLHYINLMNLAITKLIANFGWYQYFLRWLANNITWINRIVGSNPYHTKMATLKYFFFWVTTTKVLLSLDSSQITIK